LVEVKEADMESAPPTSVWVLVTDFLADDPTPQKIIEFRFPPEIEARLHHLLDLNGEGELTYDEEEELATIINADTMMSLLKAKTKLKLQDSMS
jgi:hypothetical protein